MSGISSTSEDRAAYVASLCREATQHSNGNWTACCPAHDDHHPSLSIGTKGEKVVLHCFAKCDFDSILSALGLTRKDLYPQSRDREGQYGLGMYYDDDIIAVYDYHDEHGTVRHQVCRTVNKVFPQRQPDPTQPGRWKWGVKGIRTFPYHLPAVLTAIAGGELVYITEGEKDADAAVALGLTATCNPGGAGAGWHALHVQWLRGAHVVILPDYDAPGQEHAQDVARKLRGIAASVKIIADVHTDTPGSDLSDWLAYAGGTRAQLDDLVASTPVWSGPPLVVIPPTKGERNGHHPTGGPLPPPAPPGAPPPPSPPGTDYDTYVVDPDTFYTDTYNARALVAAHGPHLHYVYLWKRWLVWDGSSWAEDVSGRLVRLGKQTIKQLALQVPSLSDSQAKQLLGHIKSSMSTPKLNAMIENARSEPGIALQPDDLDRHHFLLNTANGTIDLTAGALCPQRPTDLLSKCLTYGYDADAACATWEMFIDTILAGDRDLIEYVQRAVGYALTGDTREQCVFLLHGGGSNGKSTFIETLQALLEVYAQGTPSATILAKERGTDAIPNDIARLRGARLVTAVEIGEGRRLDEALIKRLSGQDKLTARFLHAEFFDFIPEFKLFIACNRLPQIRGTDHAIWRRIRCIPFNVTIAEEDQDKLLPAKLKAELPGILAWAVRGCLAWQEYGLRPPDSVVQATSAYQTSQDVVGRFIEEACYVSDRSDVRTRVGDLYSAYKTWCETTGEYAITLKNFGTRLDEHGITKERGRVVWCLGVGLHKSDD